MVDRLDKFVGDAALIGPLHRLHRIGELLARAFGHRRLGAVDAIPALVAIHGVVAPGERRDLTHADAADLALESFDIAGAGLRPGVAAVHEAVNEDVLHALALGHLQQRVKVCVHRVNAAVAQQTHQVQAMRARVVHRGQQRGVAEEIAAGNHAVDARHIHVR